MQANDTTEALQSEHFNIPPQLVQMLRSPLVAIAVKMMDGTNTRREILQTVALEGGLDNAEAAVEAAFSLLRECTAFVFVKRPLGQLPASDTTPVCSFAPFQNAASCC